MATFKVEFFCPHCQKQTEFVEFVMVTYIYPLKRVHLGDEDVNKALDQREYDGDYGRRRVDEDSYAPDGYGCGECGWRVDIECLESAIRWLADNNMLKKISKK